MIFGCRLSENDDTSDGTVFTVSRGTYLLTDENIGLLLTVMLSER